MAVTLLLFFVIDPIYAIIAGAFAGRNIKGLWSVPVMAAILFLLGAWIFFYMIGESDCLRKGFGKMIAADLTGRIALHPDAKRIAVQPEPENKASCGLLLSSGFVLDTEKEIYAKLLP